MMAKSLFVFVFRLALLFYYFLDFKLDLGGWGRNASWEWGKDGS